MPPPKLRLSPAARTFSLWFAESVQSRKLRTMAEFAESEFVIPDGPFKDLRFSASTQPFTKLWFAEVDSGRWNRIVSLGPSQSGKSLLAFIIVTMYHLFEIGETVIWGVPKIQIARDKWLADLLPAIRACRYKDLLPKAGPGSKGGSVDDYVQFQNGAVLKFMAGGGSDKARAAFTSRVLVVTETDGMDLAGGTSREADKITQLEARTRSFADRKRIYLECTVSTEAGRTWQEYQKGTKSRIVRPCPHCGSWVTPERDDLVGWKDAADELAAREKASWACPVCGELWTDAEREAANRGAKLLHDGQAIDAAGVVAGDPPRTMTLGFRWTAADNQFVRAADVGADEWKAARAENEENAEREMRQFVWALPHVPRVEDLTQLDARALAARQGTEPPGVVPRGFAKLTVGCDLGQYLAHWCVAAWTDGATGQVVDYGVIEVPSRSLGVERGLVAALNELRTFCDRGWFDGDGSPYKPAAVWVDSGWKPEAVYAFAREAGPPYQPSKGFGTRQKARYAAPKSVGDLVAKIGRRWHLARQRAEKIKLAEFDADHWKSWLHARLSTPVGQSGALTLPKAPPASHLSYVKHLTAEKQVEDPDGTRRWENVRDANHWLDATVLSCLAADSVGVQLLSDPKKKSSMGESSWVRKRGA
ncbi:MAG: terminase gpA endonuclease subunit [Planctomycetia bacterium]